MAELIVCAWIPLSLTLIVHHVWQITVHVQDIWVGVRVKACVIGGATIRNHWTTCVSQLHLTARTFQEESVATVPILTNNPIVRIVSVMVVQMVGAVPHHNVHTQAMDNNLPMLIVPPTRNSAIM